ncbi:unnamed protein product [Cryptosporidium hominis]|uniref:Uncharacterized protein n=1 Tax=Cryptosporidium hominis TaxID=237895 RepID=A0A0S4TF79_CRYHO|nr:hypothetical protein ChTU502y2012_295g0530 [Cryptosporidium hominis]PPA64265.1 hypothetical protein ChUKH1_03825 [Cryptosporidium hominis]CUV05662.1 unnamed protein product [Cryptosporidium hominis]
MSESLENNDAYIFKSNQRKNFNDMIKIFRGKILSKSDQLNNKRNSINCTSSTKKISEKFIFENSDINDDKDSHINIAHLSNRLQLRSMKNEFEGGEIINLKRIFNYSRPNRNFFRRKKSEEKLEIQEKKLTSKDLFERIESARDMGRERIKRANFYYNKLLSYVKYYAVDEASEFIINDLSRREIYLLVEHDFKHVFSDDLQEKSLQEVYSQVRSKLYNSAIDNKGIPLMFEEIIDEKLFETKEAEEDFNFDFLDSFSNLRLQSDENLNAFLNSIGTSNAFVEFSIEYLLSRTCNVSLEVNRTVVDCIKKDIIDIDTGIYKKGR